MLSPGQHRIGPANGRLTLLTFREGMAAVVGHDLVIDITRWQGTVTVPEGSGSQPRLAVEIDLSSFEVREGLRGVKPLTDSDRQEIKGQSFESTTVRVQGDGATVDGQFTLAGVTHPLRISVQAKDDRRLTGKAIVQQRVWGIKPYKAFMGALKVRDTVEVEATVTLAG